MGLLLNAVFTAGAVAVVLAVPMILLNFLIVNWIEFFRMLLLALFAGWAVVKVRHNDFISMLMMTGAVLFAFSAFSLGNLSWDPITSRGIYGVLLVVMVFVSQTIADVSRSFSASKTFFLVMDIVNFIIAAFLIMHSQIFQSWFTDVTVALALTFASITRIDLME